MGVNKFVLSLTALWGVGERPRVFFSLSFISSVAVFCNNSRNWAQSSKNRIQQLTKRLLAWFSFSPPSGLNQSWSVIDTRSFKRRLNFPDRDIEKFRRQYELSIIINRLAKELLKLKGLLLSGNYEKITKLCRRPAIKWYENATRMGKWEKVVINCRVFDNQNNVYNI